MLDKQTIPISFAQGLDSKTDEKQVVPGKLIELENGVFFQTKSLRKRDGFDALPTDTFSAGNPVTSGVGLATFKDELVEVSEDAVESFTDGPQKWSTLTGTFQATAISSKSIFQDGSVEDMQDTGYHAGSGLQCFAWRGSNSVGEVQSALYYSIIDKVTGQKIVSKSSVVAGVGASSVDGIKVMVLGSLFYLIYVNPGTTTIIFRTISVSDPTTLSASVSIATNAKAPFRFDAAVFNSKIYVAYYSSSGGDAVTLRTITGLTVSASTNIPGEIGDRCMTIFGDTSNNAWIIWASTTYCRGAVYDSTLTTQVIVPQDIVVTGNVVNVTGIFVNGSSPIAARVFIERSSTNIYDNRIELKIFRDASVTTEVQSLCLGLASKVFQYSGHQYLLATYRSYQQPTYFLLQMSDDSTATAVAKVYPSTAGGHNISLGEPYGFLSEAVNVSTDVYEFAALQVNDVYTSLGDFYYSYGVTDLSATFNGLIGTIETPGSLLIGSGILSSYDGARVVEHGFNMYPEFISFSADTGGGSIAAGTYSYVAVYEWVDIQGQKYQSAPSNPRSHVVAGANQTVNLNVSTLRLTQKTNVKLAIYRTENAGTVYYLVSNTDLNDTSAFTVAIADTTSDAQLVTQGTLYTTGGEVENLAPPSPLTMGTYKNRIVLVPADNQTSFWYTKELLPNSPADFSDLFVQNIDQRGGGITAVTQMDDKLCLFKEQSIFVMTGDGPSPSGANNDFTPAQLIASDSGCIDDRSLVLMPMGVMYQSSKGIYLLGRNLQVSYIGADVEAYNSNTITSAKLFAKRNQVIFTLDSGVALVYDYAFQQWSVFTGIDAVAVAVYQDKIAYAKSDGTVMLETPGVYNDNGSGYALKLKTSWLSFAGLQGFQRVYDVLLLGEYKSSHTLQVKAAHDFIDTVDQTVNITGSSTPPYQYKMDFKKQKCESVQLTIQDTSPTGESFEISAMSFEVGVKRGANKLSQTRNYG